MSALYTSVYICSKLTAKQKALILSFAELDTTTKGSVNGVAEVNSGKSLYIISYYLCMSACFS